MKAREYLNFAAGDGRIEIEFSPHIDEVFLQNLQRNHASLVLAMHPDEILRQALLGGTAPVVGVKKNICVEERQCRLSVAHTPRRDSTSNPLSRPAPSTSLETPDRSPIARRRPQCVESAREFPDSPSCRWRGASLWFVPAAFHRQRE